MPGLNQLNNRLFVSWVLSPRQVAQILCFECLATCITFGAVQPDGYHGTQLRGAVDIRRLQPSRVRGERK